ncbi:growth arrest and DNA damage-inducible protein GADD45 alpha-like isoform X2 [Pomacea canaliculata]|uniref:growth arrest and DNA damage-inducible protein GADD45 alpha-like isoform X2 n=1 Tax=Pomacea canaliculata TaxID=400727 RepID=UPI000D732B51|nr:growth arrest and DNA damage-inducible protein GADD45 alpha-like isoform X2 [Pomacea canaliculata]
MTFSDYDCSAAAPADRQDRVARGVGVALAKCLRQAMEQGRMTTGIWHSARVLQRRPERVLVCILPTVRDVNDHALHIHHTLITAFCWEHGIRLLKVEQDTLHDAMMKLWLSHHDNENSALPSQTPSPSPSASPPAEELDVRCVLIETSLNGLSFEDEVVLDFHDEVMVGSCYPKPVLKLPG